MLKPDGPFDVREALSLIKSQGYNGVEAPLKLALSIGPKWTDLLKEYQLNAVYMVFTDGPVAPGYPEGFVMGGPYDSHPMPGNSIDDHLNVFKRQVEVAYGMGSSTVLVNSHTGCDHWTVEQGGEFFKKALAWQKDNNFRVVHETHRTRFLYSPWVTRDILENPDFSGIEFNADLSHYTCVSETDPSNPVLDGVVKRISQSTGHIHGRIGYENGPQVNDPRAPEWTSHVEGFFQWWERIWELQAKRGLKVSTFTPEHGPAPYQISFPYQNTPMADIWNINHWIALKAQERFARKFSPELSSSLVKSE